MSAPRIRLIAAVALALGPGLAQAGAAQFLFVLNRVEVERGATKLAAQRSMEVEIGDIVHTGPIGYTQLRFKDGALMALKPGTSLKIEDFAVPVRPAASAPSPAAAPVRPGPQAGSPGRSVLRLLRGAFRTITGAIGKGQGDDYRVLTETATIGIRGTDFSAAIATSGLLYVGVSNGQVVISNAAGQLVLYNNQYGLVRSQGSPPVKTIAPPPSLETTISGSTDDGSGNDDGGPGGDSGSSTESGGTGSAEGGGDGGGSGSSDGGGGSSSSDSGGGDFGDSGSGDGGPSSIGQDQNTSGSSNTTVTETQEPEGTYELQPGLSSVFAFSTSPFQSQSTFAGVGLNGIYTDGSGNASGFLAGDAQSVTVYTIGSAQNRNLGSDSDSGLRWGRWSGGTATVRGQPLDLNNQSLHWIFTLTSSNPVIPTSGTASFALIGNTDPTDNLGNVGFLGNATLTADFSNQRVISTLDLGINSQVWQASGSGSIITGAPVFAGSYDVNVNDAAGLSLGTGTGDFTGFFTDNAAAAGLSYSLSSGAGGATTSVSGVAAFTNSGPGP